MTKQKKNRKVRDEFRYSVYLSGLSDPIASLRGLWICVVRQSHRRRTECIAIQRETQSLIKPKHRDGVIVPKRHCNLCT